jgi:hypothetical protein
MKGQKAEFVRSPHLVDNGAATLGSYLKQANNFHTFSTSLRLHDFDLKGKEERVFWKPK